LSIPLCASCTLATNRTYLHTNGGVARYLGEIEIVWLLLNYFADKNVRHEAFCTAIDPTTPSMRTKLPLVDVSISSSVGMIQDSLILLEV
jgi:hypothetical protein